MRVAAIDLGSNAFHLLIAETLGPASFEPILQEEMIIQLGKASLLTGRLDPQSTARGLRSLDLLRRMAFARGVERTVAVATSAVREAENGEEFLQRAREECGIPVRIISGREEARLIHLAASRHMDLQSGKSLLIDVGGGGVKLAIVDAAKVYYSASTKLGFLRLLGRFVSSDPISRREVRTLTAFLRDSLANPLANIRRHAPGRIIVTGGSIRSLLRLAHQHRSQAPCESASSDHVTRDEVRQILSSLAAVPMVERIRQFDLDPLRAEYLPTALHTLLAILDGLGAGEVAFCPVALREGLIYQLLGQTQPQPLIAKAPEDLRFHAVMDLAGQCNYPIDHSHRVAHLAGQIFRQTTALHGLGESEARMLEYASILHDIGYHVGYAGHHRHAYHLVMSRDLRGFVPEERCVLANLVRYHRRGAPKTSDKPFAGLPSRSRMVVRYLTAILRVADALDMSHFSLVDEVRCTIEKRRVRFELAPNRTVPNAEFDLWAARGHARYFEKVFKVVTSFVVKKTVPLKEGQV